MNWWWLAGAYLVAGELISAHWIMDDKFHAEEATSRQARVAGLYLFRVAWPLLLAALLVSWAKGRRP